MTELAQDLAPQGPGVTPFATSLAQVPYTKIRELGELAMSTEGVLRLYFGESNLPTPVFIVDAAVRALREGQTFYSENAGLPPLRREIAGQYRRLHDVELDPECEIVVTASGVQALHLAIRSVVDPGDEVVILSPAWPNSTSIVALSHGVPIDVPLALKGERYQIDFAALEAALGPRTRLIVLTSPSNPLGWVADVHEQLRLLELCRDRGIWLLADEVYERIFYAGAEIGDPAPSILRLCDRDDPVHVVQSFSKSYCMTGWRVGWLVTRRDLGPKLAQLNEFFVSHAATFAQVAAQTALAEGEAELQRMVADVQGKSRLLRRSAARHPPCDRSRAGRSLLRLPTSRRARGLVRLLPPAACRTEGRPRSRLGFRSRRRRVGQDLLRSRPLDPRGGARTPRELSQGWMSILDTKRSTSHGE